MAAADGELAPTEAASLISALGALARMVETDELSRRVEALEGKHSNG